MTYRHRGILILLMLLVAELSTATAGETFKIEADFEVGDYWLRDATASLPITVNEQAQLREKMVELKSAKLPGTLSLKEGEALGITIVQDERGLLEKLRKVSDVKDRVQHLCLFGIPSQECLVELTRFQNLRFLELIACETVTTAEGSACLGKLQKLEWLGIGYKPVKVEIISPEDFQFGTSHFCDAISRLSNLRHLEIPCERLSNKDVRKFAKCAKLESLVLLTAKQSYDGKTIRQLSELPKLRELAITGTDDLTSEDLAGFSERKDFERLMIQSNADPGIAKGLQRQLPKAEISVFSPDDN